MPRNLAILLPVIVTATTVAFAIGTLASSEQSTTTQTPLPKLPPREIARVHVTFGPKHEPLVGAAIRWIGIPLAPPRSALSWIEDSAERGDLLAGVPALAATDEHGDVAVILEGPRVLVEARAGGLWGAQVYDSDLFRNNPAV